MVKHQDCKTSIDEDLQKMLEEACKDAAYQLNLIIFGKCESFVYN